MEQPLEVIVPDDDPLAMHMIDLKARKIHEREQTRNQVLSAVNAQAQEEQRQQEQQEQHEQQQKRFKPIIYKGK